MNSLNKVEGVPLLNFKRGPEVTFLNFKGGPGVLLLNFEWGPTFTPCYFKHKRKRLQIPQKLVYEKFYAYEKTLRTRNCRRKFIRKIYFLKNEKKTCKPSKGDLNHE